MDCTPPGRVAHFALLVSLMDPEKYGNHNIETTTLNRDKNQSWDNLWAEISLSLIHSNRFYLVRATEILSFI